MGLVGETPKLFPWWLPRFALQMVCRLTAASPYVHGSYELGHAVQLRVHTSAIHMSCLGICKTAQSGRSCTFCHARPLARPSSVRPPARVPAAAVSALEARLPLCKGSRCCHIVEGLCCWEVTVPVYGSRPLPLHDLRSPRSSA